MSTRTQSATARSCPGGSSQDTEKFDCANSKGNEGLGVETRDGESRHFGAALFNRGEYALHELDLLAQRHPTSQRRRCND